MTKFAKISLVAAVAVAGLTTANAQPLEEAIKGVDVSGMLRYRYDDTQNQLTDASTQTNEYTMKIATKAKVNDAVTANVQVEALGVSDISSSDAHATSDATGDRDVTLSVTKANFAVNLAGATVIAGKQSVPSPFVDNWNDDVTRGTGAVALVPAGPVTIAAGYFSNFQRAEAATNSGANITAAAVLGSVAGVNFDVWYADVANTVNGVSVGLNTTIAGVNIDARHTDVDYDAAATKDPTLTKVVASTKVGPVTVVAGYGHTNKSTASVDFDGDNDAKVDMRLWQASLSTLSDADAYLIGAAMEVLPSVTLDAKYLVVDFNGAAAAATGTDATELLVGATYAMSKNFSVHARYSEYKVENAAGTKLVDSDKGRLEVKYTF